MTKVIIVSGGGISGIGKGIVTAALGASLTDYGYKVQAMKLDPYLNYSAGRLNPEQHGEVYVTVDGGETDLDLGHYERFLGVELTAKHCVTSGQIYKEIIDKEQEGGYNGHTVQTIPHVTNVIQDKIKFIIREYDPDILLVEIGGTVGDIESLPYLDAVRQFKLEYRDSVFIHVCYVPYLSTSEEYKTKPVQHSVSLLRSYGINPDFIVARVDNSDEIPYQVLIKISKTCGVHEDKVIGLQNLDSVYEAPHIFKDEFTRELLCTLYPQEKDFIDLGFWGLVYDNCKLPQTKTKSIAIVGKYLNNLDSYKSIIEALKLSCLRHYPYVELNIEVIDSDSLSRLKFFDGIIIPGGFGLRGMEGKIEAAKFGRVYPIPTLGICMGFQAMAIEYVRSYANETKFTPDNINSAEFYPNNLYNVITPITRDKRMILGSQKFNQVLTDYYMGEARFRNRYGLSMSNRYIHHFQDHGMKILGTDRSEYVVAIQLENHPFYLGVQFHPEFDTNIVETSPIFDHFLEAVIA